MPSAARYIHNGSHPALIAWAKEHHPKEACTGHEYRSTGAAVSATQDRTADGTTTTTASSVQAKDILYGLQMACLSITDDSPDTVQKVGIMNPWQIQSMKILTGSTEKAHAPLTEILTDCFDGLLLDHHINISGVSTAGHALDTQGFIAHNDTTIVLSYRCTTSAADWMTNLTTTTSAWEIEEDVAQGHSGWWSCCAGYGSCVGGAAAAAPRVHTGFYNNFLVTVPLIRQYIDPLLNEPGKNRTLFVVGHSLGAGIATLAGCYFLLEPGYDWSHASGNTLRIVTAGGPRACGTSMARAATAAVDASPAAQFLRCVRDKDGVSQVPPAVLGFGHIDTSVVYVTKEDATTGQSHVLINPNRALVVPKQVLQSLAAEHADLVYENDNDNDDDDDDDKDGDDDDTGSPAKQRTAALPHEELDPAYEQKIGRIPRSLRDHMPEFYLRPLYRAVAAEEQQQQQTEG